MDAASQHRGRARPIARNWAFLVGLGICSLAVAGLGIFGWALSRAPIVGVVLASAFCVAAQFVAACCGANFGRHTWRAAWFTRLMLLTGYLVAATFAAYSADQGWMTATAAGYNTEVGRRANERGRIEAEIAEREGYVRIAEGQRALVRAPGPMLTAQLQAPYSETIRRNEARLRELRAELESKPALPQERERTLMDWALLAAFVFWQALEPWLYHAVEKGRRPTAPIDHAQPRQPFEVVEGGRSTDPSATPRPNRPTRRFGVLAGLVAWLALLGQQAPDAAEASTTPPPSANQSTPSTKPPLELVVAADQGDDPSTIANRLSAQKWSERKIASELHVTRYQVRVWLGREKQAA